MPSYDDYRRSWRTRRHERSQPVTSDAQTQVTRMLELVPYLRQRDEVPVDEVARDFGVSPSQVVKDLKVLWFCGLPNSVSGDLIDIDMELLEGEGVVRLSNADFLARPLRLDRQEALAMTVALRTLRGAAGAQQREVVDRVLDKLGAALGDSAAVPVDIHIDEVDPAIRKAVDEALEGRRRLHLRYYVPARDESTERDVDPMRLLFSEGHGYLEAWCHLVRETRLFRLDRIEKVTVLEAAAEPPDDAEQRDLSQGLFQPDPADPVAVVDLAAQARWVAEYYPIESRTEGPDGRLRITLRYADPAWLQWLILRLGGDATLIEPADLAAEVVTKAQAALSRYTG